MNKSDSDEQKKLAPVFFPGKIGVTPLGAAPDEGPHIFYEQGPA